MQSRSAFCLTVACIALLSSPAYAIDGVDLQVSRLGDTEMSCGDLSLEAETMRDIINTTEEIKQKSELQNRGVTAAGAIGSFLVGTMTGGIGIAAAGFLAEHEIDEKGDKADSVQDIAEQRRSLMLGIYNAKGCLGPIEHAMQDAPENTRADRVAETEPAAGEDGETPQKIRYNQ